MHTEIPALKEHAAINHLKHKSSLRNASHKNSPPESSNTKINHVSQESQGKSGITERGVVKGREAFSPLSTLRRAPSTSSGSCMWERCNIDWSWCTMRVQVYKVPIFKGSSYLCTQCIMHQTQCAIRSAHTQPVHALSFSYPRTVVRHQKLPQHTALFFLRLVRRREGMSVR